MTDDAEALAERVRALADGRPGVVGLALRPEDDWVSGTFALTVNEHPAVVVLSDGGLMVRVAKADHAVFGAEPGVRPKPLNPRGAGGWLRVAVSADASDAELRAWVERGLAFAGTLPHPDEYS
ncbi:RNA methyltransferase [Glycomyces albidus]|jgi:hypothetical protein|uniref:RNA methyltransferase n=1 Tax=Glycomyces albidus TaxID=2656774 RepID=A0A6L5G469_9ACTN|nr:RNA methyltransferase [Glycomyces albidus]MQM24436.1 RNA methyltransferase [Glycomyces albidus]